MIVLNPNQPKKRCVIYLRVSSVKQTSDGAGLSSQERSCREYAERNRYEVVEVFKDVISGRFAERPGMNALLAYLKSVDASNYVVVVDDISRFARAVSTHAALRDKIIASGAKIESPNQKFGEDSGSRFIETIMAAIAEHDRERNAEQSHRRTIARLQNGYWVFHAPLGYRYEKAPGGGKMMVRDEPLASIVTEALEGYASGRFQTQVEVKRFLDAKPEFPKSYRGTEVHFDKVKRLLNNVLYAGYLQFPKWDIPLTMAKHEALISYSTHQIIVERLAEKSVAPARKDISADFPLRGFLLCDECGRRLTACWAQSHTGKKYPYYLCHHRSCARKGKSIPRDQIERQFEELLKRLTPARTTLELARSMFKEAWEVRSANASAEAKRLLQRSRNIQREIDGFLARLVKTENERLISAYEDRISELEQERALCEDEASRVATPAHPFDEMFELAMRFLSSPFDIWKNGDLAVKKTVLRLAFSQPLVVSSNKGVQTGETTFPFKALEFLSASNSKVVRAAGLEPARPFGPGILSAMRLPFRHARTRPRCPSVCGRRGKRIS